MPYRKLVRIKSEDMGNKLGIPPEQQVELVEARHNRGMSEWVFDCLVYDEELQNKSVQ